MANISIDISVNASASFSYLGHNASHQLLYGTLDHAHNSTLSGYWINYPTPWPYLLITVAISIGLGWLGFRSSAKSWHPVHKHKNNHTLLPSNDVEMSASREDGLHDDETTPEATPQPKIYTDKKTHGFFSGIIAQQQLMKGMTRVERKRYLANKDNNLAIDAQRTAEAEYAAAGDTYDLEDDIRPDGGMGKFSMYKTIFGICWTTLRAISVFIVAIQIAHGSDSNSSYPGPLSVMTLFASAHTFLAGRGMPRLFNVIVAYDLVLIWIAFVLASFGPNSTIKYYGKIGVQGGNCPYFDRPKYLSNTDECAYGRWNVVGCATNSTWDTSAHDYPRAAWWFNGNPDPNSYGNSLLTLQLDFKLIGIIYGLIILFLSFPFYFLPLAPRLLRHPLPAIKTAFLRRMSYTMSLVSFTLVVILSVIAVPLHISGELQPPKFTYVDSVGPLVPTAFFDDFDQSTAVEGQWPSVAWNQSHVGVGNEAQFLGGNETSWSDCFWVQAPPSKTGHLSDWWQADESKALRILGGF